MSTKLINTAGAPGWPLPYLVVRKAVDGVERFYVMCTQTGWNSIFLWETYDEAYDLAVNLLNKGN